MGIELSAHEQAKVLYSEGEIAYVAGIFDGEGCISACTYATSDGVLRSETVLTITNTNKDVLDVCQIILGGKVRLLGKRRKNEKPVYRLQIADIPTVERAISIIFDWLIVKRAVAELMLELIDSKKTHYGYDAQHIQNDHGCNLKEQEIIVRIHELNRKGVR